jgi:hypothetical protein
MVFNFDEWAELYKRDPVEFESRRKQVLADMIAQAPADKQLKLHQLQWKLDAIHQTQTPIQALLNMQRMMWDSFLVMSEQLQVWCNHIDDHQATPRPKLTLVK